MPTHNLNLLLSPQYFKVKTNSINDGRTFFLRKIEIVHILI
jgi:hypothetical protein